MVCNARRKNLVRTLLKPIQWIGPTVWSKERVSLVQQAGILTVYCSGSASSDAMASSSSLWCGWQVRWSKTQDEEGLLLLKRLSFIMANQAYGAALAPVQHAYDRWAPLSSHSDPHLVTRRWSYRRLADDHVSCREPKYVAIGLGPALLVFPALQNKEYRSDHQ
jgi:hypothetical protein